MKLDHLLSRADDGALQELLGGSALRLLLLLDPTLATPAQLQKLIIELHTPAGLLLSRESRNIIFDLLPSQQATILATILGASSPETPYQALKKISFRRASDREALFDFFELDLPVEEEQVQAPSFEVIPCHYPLFRHQRQAARSIKKLLQKHPHRVLLHMPTGSGKTRTAMNVIVEHLREYEPVVVIWLAYSEELCEQAVSEFESAWSYLGNREANVYRFWGNRDLEPTTIIDGFIVASLSKMYNAVKKRIQFINALGKATSLVIIDEAHSAIAETYQLILEALVIHRPTTGLLGLSATPGRTWADIHIDEQLADFFARQKVTLQIEGYDNPVDYLVDRRYLAKVDYTSLFYEGGLTVSKTDLQRVQKHLDIPEDILQRLADDEKRNLAIITRIETLAHRHRRILVFAATVDHSNLLASVLRARGLTSNSITGKTPTYDRARVIEAFKEDTNDPRIICNYGVLTTGFDAPKTSAAVIARPTKSLVLYSQMVGRVIRGPKAGGNEMAEVVTVVDHDLPGFGSVAKAFNNWEDVWE